MTTRALTFFLVLCAFAAGVSAQSPSQPAIEQRVLALADQTRIQVLQAGHSSSAPALVFIPGWTMPASLWNQQIRRFSGDRLVIAIDPRSQGDSSKTEKGNTPEQRARDLHEILSIFNIPTAVLIGWSQGVQDVAAYIQQFGTASVAGLVFVDSPVSAGPLELEDNKEEAQQFFGRIGIYVNHPAEYCEGMVQYIFKKPPADLNLEQVIANCRKTPVPTGVTMLIMDLYAVDRRPALAKIDRPTLVIASAESPLLKSEEKMASAIRGSQFVTIKGAGHGVFIDDPQAFDDALNRLLKSIRNERASGSL